MLREPYLKGSQMLRTADPIQCACAACVDTPFIDPWMGPMGENIDGRWWCEWCLSCGCHDGQGNGLPNCSTERFGFSDVAVFEPDGPPVQYDDGRCV